MIRVALKGLAARPLRTALTALAIVLGVAMVSARVHAHRHDARRGRLAVLAPPTTAPTPSSPPRPRSRSTRPTGRVQRPDGRRASCSTRVRAVPQSAAAVGDITDEAKIIGRDGKPVGDGPYFGVGFDRRTPAPRALTPFRLEDGRWATGAGRGRASTPATAEQAALRGRRPRPHHHARRGRTFTRRRHRALRQRQVARHRDRRGVRPARPRRSCSTSRAATTAILVAGATARPAPTCARRVAAALGASAQVQTAAAQDRFTLDGLKSSSTIIKIVLLVFGGVAILVGAFTIFNTLSITVAQRTRELALLRMVGAARRQVLGSVHARGAASSGCSRRSSASRAGFGLAKGLNALFARSASTCPRRARCSRARTVDRVAARSARW